MPRVKKTVRKNQTTVPKETRTLNTKGVRNKNKQKVVVRNVININSNNKRKGITKPSFSQLSQQPRSQGSTVVSHFLQQPTSAYNPQGESSLVKSMDIMNNLINKYAERESVLYNDSLNRLKENLKAPKAETPLQNASSGRRLNFDIPSPSSSGEEKEGLSPVIEKGGGGFFSRMTTPFRNPNMVTSFGGSDRGRGLDEILRGTRPSELGSPQASALGFSPPRTALRGNERILREELEGLSKHDLRALYKNITNGSAPSASKETDIINKLINEFREKTGRMLVQTTIKKGKK